MPPAISHPSAELLRLPRARGALDVFTVDHNDHDDNRSVTLAGWLAHPDHVLDGATAFLDDVAIGACTLIRREDLVGIWPHLPTTHISGFNIRGPLPPTTPAASKATPHVTATATGTSTVRTITIRGSHNEQPIVAYRTHRHTQDLAAPPPVPGPELLQRVTGNRDPAAFAQVGLDAAMDLLRAVDRHRGLAKVHRILDWGCGPGRISAQIMNLFPALELAGSDLDPEGIAWCNQHLRAGAFHVTKPFPPLPFPDHSFDAVVAVSVMTHLDWPVQKKWLAEMRRLLRPGGVFAASVHGPFAAAFFPGERNRLTRHDGFHAESKDKSLDGIAPRGYYRSAFQTPEFTHARWAEELEVADYFEAGLAGFQDLVVVRKG